MSDSRSSPSRRTRIQALLLLGAMSGAGLLLGMTVERARSAEPPAARPGPPGPHFVPPGFRALNLTDEQRAQMAEVFEAWRPRTDSVMLEVMPRLRAIRDSVQAELRTILAPDQQAVFDTMLQEAPGPWRARPRPGGGAPMPTPPPPIR
jgi:Spy/CpxP family protein refolding chaperone